MPIINSFISFATANHAKTSLSSWAVFAMRIYVASIFLHSGTQKISQWESTVFLFQYEYQVPFLSPHFAAILGTATEVILPLLIILGIMTRLSALALWLFNFIAVASYPILTTGTWGVSFWGWLPTALLFPNKGFEDHFSWGLMLFVIIALGAGKYSIDTLLRKHCQQH